MNLNLCTLYDRPYASYHVPVDVPCGKIRFGASTVLKTSHCKIETSPGVFNWSDMDWIVNEIHVNCGREPAFQIGGTPQFYATDPNPATLGAWGPGTNSPYVDTTKLTNFLVALQARYPHTYRWTWMGANELNTPKYSLRTGEQAAIEQKVLWDAVPRTDFVISANCVGGNNTIFADFLNAGGHLYCDAIGYMAYGGKYLADTIKWVRAQLDRVGCTKPIHIIECGIFSGSGGTDKDLCAYNAADQARWMKTTLQILKDCSVAEVYWYAWNHETCGLEFASGALTTWKAWT